MRIALALLSLLAGHASAATYVCTRSAEGNVLTTAYFTAGSCTPTGLYTGAGGDTVGSAATKAATAAVFCGSPQKDLRTLVLGPGSNKTDAVSVVYGFDQTTWKLLAYTAAASPSAGQALVEGDATLTLTNVAFPFIAICK